MPFREASVHKYFRNKGRDICEVCEYPNGTCVIERPFADSSIRDFIENYYNQRVPQDLFSEAPFEIRHCPRCDFMWQRFVLSDAAMVLLYEDWISREESLQKKRVAEVDLYADYAAQLCGISVLLNRKPHSIRILDYGMGWGYYCLMAKAFGYESYGCEFSSTRIEYARKNGVQVIALDQLAEFQFDFINSEQTFEHLPSPLGTLKRLADCLRRDGIIRIAVPDSRPARKGLADSNWRAAKNAFHPLEHINCFTHKSLVELGHRVGLVPARPPRSSPQPLLARAGKKLGGAFATIGHFGWNLLNEGPTAMYFRLSSGLTVARTAGDGVFHSQAHNARRKHLM